MTQSITRTLADFREAAESLWPVATAESWDRVGLVTGRDGAPLRRVLLAVDAVRETVDEALDWGASVLLTHHPLLLRGVNSIAEDTGKGAMLADLIRGDCALIAAHTTAVQPEGGVSAVIAERLGLVDARAIVPGKAPGPGAGEEPGMGAAIGSSDGAVFGIGRVGSLVSPVTLAEFAAVIAAVLPATVGGVRVGGDPDRLIRTVALCGGAGDSLLDHPLVRGADAYVTSDLRHHPAQESLELSRVAGGPALIDISHWAAESLWLEGAAARLADLLPGVEFRVSGVRTDPWTFAVGGNA